MFSSSSSRARPQRPDSEETRQRILDTAVGLFRANGFDDTTMRDVSQAAGLSLGATYYYFKSKEDVVGAYYDFVQREHLERSRQAFAAASTLKARVLAAFHTKLDILQDDRRLLRALFRYGGDPDHSLSWFGHATSEQRRLSIQVFAEALEGERLPADVREMAPTLLWTMHMGITLYSLFDESKDQRRTRDLTDAAVGFVIDVRRLATLPILRPLRRRVATILRDAGLLATAARPAESAR